MSYEIRGEWLYHNNKRTRFFTEKDIQWLDAGGVPRLNKDGFMMLPFGHRDSVHLYPEIHGDESQIDVYTDGSSINNPGPGGWAFSFGGKKFFGSYEKATNNEMELEAIRQALIYAKENSNLKVYSDSNYAIKQINGEWKAKSNTRLIREIQRLVINKKLTVEFEKVEAHANNSFNNEVDKLARDAAKEQSTNLKLEIIATFENDKLFGNEDDLKRVVRGKRQIYEALKDFHQNEACMLSYGEIKVHLHNDGISHHLPAKLRRMKDAMDTLDLLIFTGGSEGKAELEAKIEETADNFYYKPATIVLQMMRMKEEKREKAIIRWAGREHKERSRKAYEVVKKVMLDWKAKQQEVK